MSSFHQRLTAAGPAAIAIVRVVGPRARAFLAQHVRSLRGEPLPPPPVGAVRRAHLLDADGALLDDIIISTHASEPLDVRLHLHGGPSILERCAELLTSFGLPHSAPEPVWPARNRIWADAYALAPRMTTARGARWLFDQATRLSDALGALLAETADQPQTIALRLAALSRVSSAMDWFTKSTRIALIGPPNAGKSTLVNRLAERPVSIVANAPGTTRDWVEAAGVIDGFPVTWIDTAGLHAEPRDMLDAAGMERTRDVADTADIVVLVVDGADRSAEAWRRAAWPCRPDVVVYNKADLSADARPDKPEEHAIGVPVSNPLRVSGLSGLGIDQLQGAIVEQRGWSEAELLRNAAFTSDQAAQLAALSQRPAHAALWAFLYGDV